MTPRSTVLLVACVAALGWSAAAGAQQPSPAKKTAAQVYDRYQASQRLRLRNVGCMEDEDMVAQYCVKKCQAGYIAMSGSALPRLCRGQKQLPPGQLSSGIRVQRADPPKYSPPSKPTPGF